MRRAFYAFAAASALVLAAAGCAASTTSSESDPSDGATQAYLAERAETLATQLGLTDPPEVEVVRMIKLNEWASTQKQCLEGLGHEIGDTADGEGIIYPSYTDPALDANLQLSIYTCELQYPVMERYMRPLSDDQLRELYQYRSGPLLECLESEGFEYAGNVPSEGVFVESGGQWSPYSGISLTDSDIASVFKACPQTPESVYE
jgi:hypothetical protein